MFIWRNKYPTKSEVKGAFMMMIRPLEVESKYVYPIPRVNPEDQPEHVLFCLCVWGEARNQCPEGQKAVAQVILNRFYAQQNFFGLSIREVILKHSASDIYQFSCMSKRDKNYKKFMNPDSLSWYKVVQAVLPLYVSLESELDENPILYYHTKCVKPEFFNKLTLRKEIGDHLFYSD